MNPSRSILTYWRVTIALLIPGVMAALLPAHAFQAHADELIPVDNTPAPEFVRGSWLNTSGSRPQKLSDRKGKVTIVHFWTFGCINCKHNLPIYGRWQKRFADRGVQIIGVHTPETPGEAAASRVAREVKKRGITYPILIDSRAENWDRWHQRYWPCVYLLDKKGRIRYRWEGELEYDHAGGEARMAQKVEELLKE